MNDINNISFSALKDSQYVKPIRMHYIQSGVPKDWDLIKIHNSVSILIFNVTRKVLVFVKQFRPDTEKYPVEQAITLELCAGIVDKDKPLTEIAKDEVLEECGYDIPASKLQRIVSYRSGIGVTGDMQTLFYVEVDDGMKVGHGGGNPEEGELIEVVELSIADAKKYLESGEVMSPGGFIFALLWFFQNKDVL